MNSRDDYSPITAGSPVLNEGIAGNRLFKDGFGPNALARFDRDVLAQTGARFVIVLEGINDIGTRPQRETSARTTSSPDSARSSYAPAPDT